MMNKSPAFQFYPADFLTDENVIFMTLGEVGMYIKLLCHCWIQGSIPVDIEKLLKILPELAPKFSEMDILRGEYLPDIVMDRFIPMPENPDRLINPRLEKERQKQADHRDARSESGKRGAQERWKNHQKKPLNSTAIDSPMAKNASLSLSLSLSSSSKTKHIVRDNFEKDWEQYPRKAGNKTKARLCYQKLVGNDPDKRKQFLEKMQAYVASIDDHTYLQHGETFFRNWKDLEVSPRKTKGKVVSSPMEQASNGRGEFVDKVLKTADRLQSEHPELGMAEVGLMVLQGCNGDLAATRKVLYNSQWTDIL